MSFDDTTHTVTVALTDDADAACLFSLAARRGWPVVHVNDFGHSELAQTLWQVSGSTELRYLENHPTGTRIIEATGGSRAEAVQVIADASAELGTLTVDDLLESLLGDELAAVDVVRAFRKLSAVHFTARYRQSVTAAPDQRYLAAIERHVGHPHRQVRLSVFLVVDELGELWPNLTAPIVARQGVEADHPELVEAFVAVAESRSS